MPENKKRQKPLLYTQLGKENGGKKVGLFLVKKEARNGLPKRSNAYTQNHAERKVFNLTKQGNPDLET